MDTPIWVSDAIFYQIFPDRFAKSDRVSKQGLNLEMWDTPPTIYGFKGGDLRGVTEHLDYIEDLGANAIYFTPVFASASNHRYHTYDYFNVDPLLGGNDALRELLDKAHNKNIRVVLDGVFNHASRGFWQFHQTLENGAASPYVDWFHFDPDRLQGKKHWGAYPSPQEQDAIQREGSYKAIGYQGWWDLPALPKFNTQTPAVREFIFNVAEYWIKFGMDGWRLDVPGEINDDSFWQEFRRRVRAINPNAYIVGEIWDDARRWLKGDQFDASMNYLVTAACLGFFTGKHLDLNETLKAGGYQGHVGHIDANEFAKRIDSILGMYAPEVTRVQLNLLGSHDTPRFLTCAGRDLNSLKLALTFIFTYPGAPCLFYGDEIGLYGRHDPECRQPFPWDQSKWNHDLRDFVKGLIALRKAHPALRGDGSYKKLYAADGIYVFERASEGETLVIALNASEAAHKVEVKADTRSQSQRQILFGQADVETDKETLRLNLAPRSGVILK
ncbi:MAG: glycoside hydrolase family 13 protein [Anaerolineales bacterium]